jgi:hypothetical protein
MTDLQHELAVAMLRIQDLLEEAELDEHVAIQNAFNALACAIDEELIPV